MLYYNSAHKQGGNLIHPRVYPLEFACTRSVGGVTLFTNTADLLLEDPTGYEFKACTSTKIPDSAHHLKKLPCIWRKKYFVDIDVPFGSLFFPLWSSTWSGSKRKSAVWQSQLLACSNMESGHVLIFLLFSDCTHQSFYITGETISNKNKGRKVQSPLEYLLDVDERANKTIKST